MSLRMVGSFLLVSALVAMPSFGQGAATALQAVRAPSKVQVDGKLDEPAWSAAVPYDQFVETFPRDNAPVPEAYRTEVKVLYDDEFLYVGVMSHDPDPSKIVAQLSRRDTQPTADWVQVAVDPSRAGNNGFTFSVNAAGVLRDTILFGDVNNTETWDAVWDGNAAITPEGWSAEFAIPFRVVRFNELSPEWGLHVRRVVPHTRQTFDSTYIPRNANRANAGALVVSRFGPLSGMVGIKPPRGLELLPYVAARLTNRPQFSDPSRPQPMLLDPTADVGLDLAMAITNSLNLNVAVNPDFGQVEADRLIQNVGTSEQFFPERRPFFTQGLDLFQPVGSEYGAQQQMFYSRRIGLTTPILGAAKVSGSIREGTEVGLLNALVMGAGNPLLNEEDPDRRWQFHLRRPFWFGPNNALPPERPVTTNYFAAVVRQQLAPGARIGVIGTSALPLERRCAGAGPECDSYGSNAAAVDFDVRTKTGEWGAFGQVTASQAIGGERRLPDGTVLSPGDTGVGFFFRAGKLGGEPFRFDVNGTFLPPELDLNQLGFQPLSNYQWYGANFKLVKPSGFGIFRSGEISYTLDTFNWSADGRWIRRGKNHWLNGFLQLPSFDVVFLSAGLEDHEYDVREIPFTGVAVEKNAGTYLVLGFETDSNRPLYGGVNAMGQRTFEEAAVPGFNGYQVGGFVNWRPMPILDTNLSVEYARRATGARFVEADGADAIFGTQFPSFFSATLRQQVVLSPRLTLQAYAQVFSASVRYGQFFRSALRVGPSADDAYREFISLEDLAPSDYAGDPNGAFAALNLNLVLRWEYRLGSTLYAVYTRSQTAAPSRDPIGPAALLDGAVNETVLVKWSYWWDV